MLATYTQENISPRKHLYREKSFVQVRNLVKNIYLFLHNSYQHDFYVYIVIMRSIQTLSYVYIGHVSTVDCLYVLKEQPA